MAIQSPACLSSSRGAEAKPMPASYPRRAAADEPLVESRRTGRGRLDEPYRGQCDHTKTDQDGRDLVVRLGEEDGGEDRKRRQDRIDDGKGGEETRALRAQKRRVDARRE